MSIVEKFLGADFAEDSVCNGLGSGSDWVPRRLNIYYNISKNKKQDLIFTLALARGIHEAHKFTLDTWRKHWRSPEVAYAAVQHFYMVR